ncbi:MAG: radical SAM family RiPP maturation amino acid epimerase, partial [Holophagales bacterium]|nr:radical SAM family RiPP maturation amino acid epimerase [Holophagales bacterium]
ASEWTEEQKSQIARVKRFSERYQGDPVFRQRLPEEMAGCMEEYGFGDLDAEAIRPVWDAELSAALQAGEIPDYRPAPSLELYSRWIHGRFAWRDGIRAGCEPTDPHWKAWRERQIGRASSEMGTGWCQSIIFDTAAIELSKGCSVGCWFCGVDAPKLEDHLRFTPQNDELFCGVVKALAEIVGPRSASAHFLYWASDPLDNPDYEDYCRRYRELLGVYPLTTTALALRDVERTRRILAMLAEDPTGVHRFSILTLKMLDRIHETFTSRELLDIELVLLNKGSMVVKANAGRFRSKAESKPYLLEQEMEKVEAPTSRLPSRSVTYSGPSSIACVSGLLINLVEKSVKLVTPCKASDRWPLGYVIFDQTTFDSPADLKPAVEQMVDAHMPV